MSDVSIFGIIHSHGISSSQYEAISMIAEGMRRGLIYEVRDETAGLTHLFTSLLDANLITTQSDIPRNTAFTNVAKVWVLTPKGMALYVQIAKEIEEMYLNRNAPARA